MITTRLFLSSIAPFVVATGLSAGCEPTSASDTNTEATTTTAEAPQVDPAAALQDKRDAWAGALCDGYLSCYDQHGVVGQVDGIIVMDLGSDGGVVGASYSGTAPVPVQECITSMFGGRRLEGYDEDGGQVTCSYSGTYNNGMMMLSQGWEYAPGVPVASSPTPAGDGVGDTAAKEESTVPATEGSGN